MELVQPDVEPRTQRPGEHHSRRKGDDGVGIAPLLGRIGRADGATAAALVGDHDRLRDELLLADEVRDQAREYVRPAPGLPGTTNSMGFAGNACASAPPQATASRNAHDGE